MTTSQVLSEKNSRRSKNLSNTLSTQPVYGIPITKLTLSAKNSGGPLIDDTGYITTHLAGRKMPDMDLDMDLDAERYLFTEFTSIFFSFHPHTVTSHTRSPRHPITCLGRAPWPLRLGGVGGERGSYLTGQCGRRSEYATFAVRLPVRRNAFMLAIKCVGNSTVMSVFDQTRLPIVCWRFAMVAKKEGVSVALITQRVRAAM